jgi:hypothetical protein
MNHLYEVPGTVIATVKVAKLSLTYGTRGVGSWSRLDTWCKGSKNLLESIKNISLTADHETVSTLTSPYSSTGAGIEMMNAACRQCRSVGLVVSIEAVATVDNDIVTIQNFG